MIKIFNKHIFFKYILPIFLITFIFFIFIKLEVFISKDLRFSLKEELRSRVEFTKEALKLWHEKTSIEFEYLASNLDHLEDVKKKYLNNSLIMDILLIDEQSADFELKQYISDVGNFDKVSFLGPVLYQEKIVVLRFKKIKINGIYKFLFVIYDFEKVVKVMKTAGRVGDSGETYIISKDGVMLSETRFYDQIGQIPQKLKNNKTALNLKIIDPQTNNLTLMAQDLIEKKAFNCNVEGYPDYRGVPVVGCWTWLEEFDFGITSEVDEAEAYSNYFETLKMISFLFVGFLSFVYFYYVYLASSSKLRNKLLSLNAQLKIRYDEMDKLVGLINNHVIISKTDKNGIITYANDKFLNVSKYTLDEIKGRYHNIVNSSFHDQDFFKEMWQVINSKKEWNGLIKNKAKDGSIYWVDSSIMPIVNENGEISEFLSIRTDITKLKEIEENLQKSKADLERHSKLKGEFIGRVSHELRTPLNAILGYLSIIAEQIQSEEIRENLKIVTKSSEDLLQIVNDILDFSKIESGEMIVNNDNFNLVQLKDELLKMFKPKFSGEVKFFVDLELEKENIILDRIKFKQILVNLTNNAYKFTEKGEVRVTIRQVQNFLSVIVRDTGRGIPEDQLSTLFSPFKQVRTKDAAIEAGVGLGLSIVKNYVEILGGRVEIQTVLGHYTEFSLYFSNINLGSTEQEGPKIATAKLSYTGKKVLVVDDNAINLKMMQAILNRFDIKADTLLDPRECVDLCKVTQFDVIFIDQLMPYITGVELANILKQELEVRPILISLSASTTVEDMNLFYETFDEVLSKPIKKENLENLFIKIFKD